MANLQQEISGKVEIGYAPSVRRPAPGQICPCPKARWLGLRLHQMGLTTLRPCGPLTRRRLIGAAVALPLSGSRRRPLGAHGEAAACTKLQGEEMLFAFPSMSMSTRSGSLSSGRMSDQRSG